MFPLLVCWRLSLTSKVSKVLRSKFFPVALFSVATFIVIATIACTAAKAFEEQTWTAFAILLVVSMQVPCKLSNLSTNHSWKKGNLGSWFPPVIWVQFRTNTPDSEKYSKGSRSQTNSEKYQKFGKMLGEIWKNTSDD